MGSSGCIIRVILALLAPVLVLSQIQNYEGYKEEFRLPGNMYPVHYWITMYTRLVEGDFCFWGSSEIKIKVIQETNQIVLHACPCSYNVRTQEIYVRYADSEQTLVLGQIEFVDEFEFMIINLQENLAVDTEYIVYIPFDGPLEDVMYGYFRTSYEDSQGNVFYFSATYFDAGKARKAFVCFDEPGYKASFTMSLAHHRDYIAISNMDIKDNLPINEAGFEDWTMTIFNDTPYLSTYMVSMMICQFEYIEVPNLSIPARIWARKDVINQLIIVQRTVERVFPAFIDLFAFELQALPKLDIIAVPKYCSNQESWGSLMIDESYVVYDENFHTIYDPTVISAEICRLLSLLWCGDLVTMEWWSNIFLAYGLSFYHQEVGLAIFFDLTIYQDIRFCTIHRIEMNDDSSVEDSQAIVAPIEFPSNLLENLTDLFERKSYMYIRQLIMILGHDAYWNGLRNYLSNYQYGVARLSNFLEELNKAGKEAQTLVADFDLNIVMERWSYGKGYPLVLVDIDYGNQIAYLRQIRFIYETRLGPDDRAQIEKECWTIPLSWVFSSNLNFDSYMVQDYMTCDTNSLIFLENFTEQDFILLNVRLFGVYRVTYSDAVWHAIAEFLRNNDFTRIDTLNRMQIISDSFEVAWAGYLGYAIPFKIAPYLRFETMEPPLRTALYSLRDVRDRLQRTDLLQQYHLFVREFLEPLYRRYDDVSLVPDSILEARFKLLVDSWAGTYGVYPCLEQSFQLLLQWYNTENPDLNNPINLNARETVYCYGIQQGNAELWQWMLQRFYGATDDDEKSRILFGLGCTTDPQIMADFLEWSLDPNNIHPCWFTTVFLSVYYNEQPTSFSVYFNFLINNFQRIIEILEGDMTTACTLVAYMGSVIEKGDELDQFQAFLNSAPVGSCQSDIDKAIRDALNNISWHELHDSEMYDLLSIIPLPAENTQTADTTQNTPTS